MGFEPSIHSRHSSTQNSVGVLPASSSACSLHSITSKEISLNFLWQAAIRTDQRSGLEGNGRRKVTLPTKVNEYDKRDIVQGDRMEVRAHHLILRLYVTQWNKNVLRSERKILQ